MLSQAELDKLCDEFDFDVLKPWILEHFSDMNVEYICKCILPPVTKLLARWMLLNQIPGMETEGKTRITEYFRQLLELSLTTEKEYIEQVLNKPS